MPSKKKKDAPSPPTPGAKKKPEVDVTVDFLGADPFGDADVGEELTWTAIKFIEDDGKVLRTLYPGCGANESTAEGGGTSKAEALWLVAAKLWKEQYPQHFAILAAGKAKAREKVQNKIKNRLKALKKETNKITKEMNQTGAGNEMTKEELDALPEDDPKRSAWGSRLEKFPFYWRMRDLIAERPNENPTALGNSEDGDEINEVSRAPREQAKSPSPPPSNQALDDDDKSVNALGKHARSSSAASSANISISSSEDDQPLIPPGSELEDVKPKKKSIHAPKRPRFASDLAELAHEEQKTMQQRLAVVAKDSDAEKARAEADAVYSKEVLAVRAQASLERERRKAKKDDFELKAKMLSLRDQFGNEAVNEEFGTDYKQFIFPKF
uniref:No apical meristem-associated C-terminal domain-containing protein n=1 Tax=Mycena chlorophos TaxID=658473 RepID=A0ABQ0L9E2_MYCCL|nr:predicted protein [Mycena chlorophos]